MKKNNKGITPFNDESFTRRRDGDRITQDWFNDLIDAIINIEINPEITGIVVGNAQDVADGVAVYDRVQDAHDNANSGEQITYLGRTWLESVTFTKSLDHRGKGSSSFINGSINFATGSDFSSVSSLKIGENITINTDVKGIYINNCFLSENKEVIDNSGLPFENRWDLLEE